ncbi:MAG: YhcG family protein [Cytophagales bacterium]
MDNARGTAYRAVNFAMVHAYWKIGRLIFEEEQRGKRRAEYGTSLLKQISRNLSLEYGKGFDESNLRHMRNFFSSFPIQDAVRPELSWTHYRLILKVERSDAKEFYMKEAIEGNWSTRALERQINTLYFERMLMTPKKGKRDVKSEAEQKKEISKPVGIIKDPYVLEFLDLKSNTKFYEHELERAIIDKLKEFLLELGKGFSFIARQYRLTVGSGKHFYADLVFYNYILKCFLVIDLKVGELTHQDIGQMDMYVRYFEDQVRQVGDNPTIGLILCSEKNRTIVKYSLLNDSQQVFAAKYKTYLPTEKQLKKEIEQERNLIESEKRLKQKS